MNHMPYESPSFNTPPAKQPAQGLSIAAMICGIASITCLALPAAVCALIFGLSAKKKNNTSGMAKAGVVCGSIGAALSLIAIIIATVMLLPMISSQLSAQKYGLTFKAHGEDAYYVDRLNKDHPEHVVIPDTYMGKPVTAIDMYAFMDRPNLVSVTIPDSVTVIAGKAFENCTALEEVKFSSNLKEIGGWAFYNCTSLKSADLPDSMNSIGENAFAGCTSLSSLHLPSGLEHIELGAFQGCTSLTEVTIPATVKPYEDFYYYYFSSEEDAGIFQNCTSLRKVTLLSDTSISPQAFMGCTSLSEVVLGSNFETLYDRAFQDCTSLKTIHLPEGLSEIQKGTFQNTGLTEITMPDGVTTIGSHAFEGCVGLTEIVIPESALYFGNGVFRNCTSLTSAILPGIIFELEVEDTFEGCTSLTYFQGCAAFIDKFGSGSKTVVTAKITGVSSRYDDPDSYSNSQYMAFSEFDALTELTLAVPNIYFAMYDSYFPQLSVIHYAGSKKEWAKTGFYATWEMASDVTIHCTDVDVIAKRPKR